VSTDKAVIDSANLVYTGAPASDTKAAVEQIEQTFAASERLKVGMSKLDSFGAPVPGVTAVAVKEILPMQLASLLKLCVVINDDETAKDTVRAGQLTNGYLMHSFIDDEGNTRQAFYSCTEASHLPETIAKQIGHKRSRKEAFGSDYALQLTHFRDYAQTLTEGGSKGEKCDYLLTHMNDTELRFVPV